MKTIRKNRTNIFLLIGIIFFFCLIMIHAQQQTLGTFKTNTNISLIQTCGNCTYCNITSVEFPNGTNSIGEKSMTKSGFKYTYSYPIEGVTGEYVVSGVCDVDGVDTVWAYSFDVTLSGINPEDSNPFVAIGILGVIFGIACIFLFLAFKVVEPGAKIFFILASLVFLVGSLAASYVIAFDSNLTSGINSTVITLMYAFGLIFIVIFAYIMINQIKAIIHSMGQNKGYEMDF